jgi:hypothetical protein
VKCQDIDRSSTSYLPAYALSPVESPREAPWRTSTSVVATGDPSAIGDPRPGRAAPASFAASCVQVWPQEAIHAPRSACQRQSHLKGRTDMSVPEIVVVGIVGARWAVQAPHPRSGVCDRFGATWIA